MKGVILGIAPRARIVDVTHDIAPHDLVEGALALEAAVAAFPRGTIHVAVVDPGVGTARRGIALETDGPILIGPDNGLFTPFLSAARARVTELVRPRYRRAVVSRTFHGRDVFAPAAAHVARGVPVSGLGPRVADPVRIPWPDAIVADGTVTGIVIHVDRFGNLVTSVRGIEIARLGPSWIVRVAGRTLPVVATYGELRPGALGAMIGSSGRIEIAAREASAAARLGVGCGARVVVTSTSSRATARPRARTTS